MFKNQQFFFIVRLLDTHLCLSMNMNSILIVKSVLFIKILEQAHGGEWGRECMLEEKNVWMCVRECACGCVHE